MILDEVTPLGDAVCSVGESPVWRSSDSTIWWVDCGSTRVLRTDYPSGATTAWQLPSRPGCLALAEDGSVVLALKDGWYSFDEASGEVNLILRRDEDLGGFHFNDGAVDTKGRFWTGVVDDERSPRGRLWVFDGQDAWASEGDLRLQNGLAFSADGSEAFVADSHVERRAIYRHKFDAESGALGARQLFHFCPPEEGRPDGAAIDADGRYWFAGIDGGALIRLGADGQTSLRVDLPVSRPTNLTFAGPNLDVLVVTTMRAGLPEQDLKSQPFAGRLLTLSSPVRGAPQHRLRID